MFDLIGLVFLGVSGVPVAALFVLRFCGVWLFCFCLWCFDFACGFAFWYVWCNTDLAFLGLRCLFLIWCCLLWELILCGWWFSDILGSFCVWWFSWCFDVLGFWCFYVFSWCFGVLCVFLIFWIPSVFTWPPAGFLSDVGLV